MEARKDIAGSPFPPEDGYLTRLKLTAYVFASFVSMGIYEGIKGPTMLDLAELFGVDVQAISVKYVWECCGMIVGSVTFGWGIERFPRHTCALLLLASLNFGFAIVLMAQPTTSLGLFYFLNFVAGVGEGALETAGSVACVETWRGHRHGSAYLHSIQFGISFGTIIGPLLASPFLKNEGQLSRLDEDYGIVTLFSLVGSIGLLSGLGYASTTAATSCSRRPPEGKKACEEKMALTEKKKQLGPETCGKLAEKQQQEGSTGYSLQMMAFVTLISLYLFLVGGVEVMVATYLPVFAVESELHCDKVESAYAMDAFWIAFSGFRFATIVAAAAGTRPVHIVLVSFALSLSSSAGLLIFAEHSFLALKLVSASLACGVASMYATTLSWVGESMDISNRVATIFSFSAMTAPNMYPLLIGAFIEDDPDILLYAIVGVVIAGTLAFVCSAVIKPRYVDVNVF